MSIMHFSNTLGLFAKINPEINSTMIQVFIYVAQAGIVNQKNIQDRLNLTNSTASRNISWWCSDKVYGKPGVGFIERYEDPTDRRYKLIRLTPAGQQFYARVVDSLKYFSQAA
jgi:DNA-binding MarR family transcriptional regulator